MKGIIIDGVVSSGKTSILKHLHRLISEQNPTSTKFFISEHYTERMLEHLKDKGELDGSHIKAHVDQLIHTLASFQSMLDNSKFRDNPKGADLFVTLERFILTHLSSVDIGDKYSLDEVKAHFEILNKLGVKQVALIIPESRLKENIMSTLQYRNDAWLDYLYSRGGEKEIIEYYINWQNNFLEYINKFKDIIDTLVIEVKDQDYLQYSNTIFNSCIKSDILSK
ncbi:MAG: hypothetical protein A2406_01655 [Candidatus Komeilibacteria bacterium RIFOXYC1_FULL_37_11]|uniref:Deoxynucleoside kinase domain-containing protein n=1 Tax=Candidatus Komeilibacteria bacterium RIFOXYC1_FULL_37_11 TaxID=1798555 RepID=A0A1G2BYB0_9BACT|nr:MAG: hypothetical protein A2406_01655 [Candidatus Komeilibacteria bacterium RIFOXYC1_FULL_37_11]OGY95329.1 MAG: hypothetical protein A2611_01360 [Candidatus Komeilibacteria bacterium RIFOXYD1_FULL_37_29]